MGRNITTLTLRAHTTPKATSWVLARKDDEDETVLVDGVITDGAPDRRWAAYFATVIDFIHSDDRTQGEIDLLVHDQQLRTWLVDQGGIFGRITVPPLSALGKRHTPKDIQQRLRRLADPDGDLDRAGIVVAATDGSVGTGRASAAWVRSDGAWGWTRAPKADVTLAELYGVKALLDNWGRPERLLVVIDSRDAVRLLNDRTIPSRTNAIEAVRTDIERTLLNHPGKVTFRWGKGHSGPGLNDGADRLAKLHRRGDISEATLRLGAGIAEEAVAAHSFAASAQEKHDPNQETL